METSVVPGAPFQVGQWVRIVRDLGLDIPLGTTARVQGLSYDNREYDSLHEGPRYPHLPLLVLDLLRADGKAVCAWPQEVEPVMEIRVYMGTGQKTFANFDPDAFLTVLTRRFAEEKANRASLPAGATIAVNAIIEHALSAATNNEVQGGKRLRSGSIEFIPRNLETGMTLSLEEQEAAENALRQRRSRQEAKIQEAIEEDERR